MTRALPLLLLSGLPVISGACGSSPEVEAGGGAERGTVPAFERASGPVVLVGTALEASTGLPLAGVLVEGPGGVQARSGPDGRFELSGLAPGAAGELRGTAEGGLVAVNRLRPLKPGRLEVVLRLR